MSNIKVKRITCIYLLLILSCLFIAQSLSSNTSFVHNEVIVKLNSDDIQKINSFASQIGAYSYDRIFPVNRSTQNYGLSRIYKLKFNNNTDIHSIILRHKNSPLIEYIQPNYINNLCASKIKPNDYFYPDQWALEKIDAPKAWKIEKGSNDIIIAVVDTGVDYNHEDLKSRIWINKNEIPNNGIDDDGNGYIDDIRGWDFYDSNDKSAEGDHLDRDNDPMDEGSHGTIVAGIIGAEPDNLIGISGVAWDCRIMALRAGNRYFEDDDLCSAIIYATDNGADIINMSWGGDELSYVIRDATKYAYDRGCVLIAAAGNDNKQKIIYPASFSHVIGVGATDKQDKKASFSNYGAGIDIVAPGDRVFGTMPKNHYSDLSGTSMATPIISGVVALMLSHRAGLSNKDILRILRYSADQIDEPLFSGVKRVNAEKALMTNQSLTAHINSPNGGESADKQFVITGTATGIRFKDYQLEFSESSNLKEWRRIDQPKNDPVWNDILSIWDVSRLTEGSYVLRLRVFGYGISEAEDRIMIYVDHTPPKIQNINFTQRLNGEIVNTIIALQTDDPTKIDIFYRLQLYSEFKKISLFTIRRDHEIEISDYLDSGVYECYFVLVNISGLITTDDNQGKYYTFKLSDFYIPIDGYIGVDTGIKAIYPISAHADFDSDGKIEIIGMDQPIWDYSITRIFEKDDDGYNEAYKSEDEFFPRDISDSDKDGLFEILCNRKDVTFLLECPLYGTYPTRKIWEVAGIWGGQFADTDLDGNIEILSSDINNSTINIYENRGDNAYLRTARLSNPTEGQNQLAIAFAISDFNSNGKIEIVGGDIDGDLFIYENNDNDSYIHIWNDRISNASIKSIISGDFDGDSIPEFAVVSKANEPPERSNILYYYAIFDWDNNGYRQIWNVEITSSKDDIGISSGDLDNDGLDELIAMVTPSLYIFKYGINPSCIWYHSASSSYNPLIQDFDNNGKMDLLFNVGDRLMAFSSVDMESVMSPWGISAIPSGEREIEIRWNGLSNSEAYRIYRGINRDNLKPIATLGLSSSFQGAKWKVLRDDSFIDAGYYRDTNVSINFEQWYAIVAINSRGMESALSEKVNATPNPAPILLSAIYSKPSALYVYFNEKMGASAKNSQNYSILFGGEHIVTPSSAILDQDDRRVVLTTEPLNTGIYTLKVSGVRDSTGVPIYDSLIVFYVSFGDSSKYFNLDFAKPYPNPVSLNKTKKLTFCCLPLGAKITIFDVIGQMINSMVVDENDNGDKKWSLDNANGHSISSGIYLYVIEFGSEKKIGKIAVMR